MILLLLMLHFLTLFIQHFTLGNGHCLFSWNGTHSMAYNVWGTYIILRCYVTSAMCFLGNLIFSGWMIINKTSSWFFFMLFLCIIFMYISIISVGTWKFHLLFTKENVNRNIWTRLKIRGRGRDFPFTGHTLLSSSHFYWVLQPFNFF